MKPLTAIIEMNSLLSRRVKRFPFLYVGGIVSGTVFLAIFCTVPLFTDLVDFNSLQERLSFYETACFMLFGIDCLFICIRVHSGTAINQAHLVLFPLLRGLRINLNVFVALCDYRSMLYAVFTLVMIIHAIVHGTALSASIALLVMSAFYTAATVWVIALLNLSGEIIRKNPANIFIVFASMTLLLNINFLFHGGIVLHYFPATSSAAEGLFRISEGHPFGALLNLGNLILIAAFGEVILFISPHQR